ncbi:MAG: hypothetical protein ACRC35_03155 [Angustibacter sp.]
MSTENTSTTAGTQWHVRVVREDGWWMVQIPAIDGLTQARRLADVEIEAADYIVLDQDAAPSSVRVVVDEVLVEGRDILADRTEQAQLLAQARTADQQLAEHARDVAVRLARHMSMRDVGAILGVTHQRVQQLIDPAQADRIGPAKNRIAERDATTATPRMRKATTTTGSRTTTKNARHAGRAATKVAAAAGAPTADKTAASRKALTAGAGRRRQYQ